MGKKKTEGPNLPDDLSSTSLRAIGKLVHQYGCRLSRITNKELDCLYIYHESGDTFIDLEEDDVEQALLVILTSLEIHGVVADLNEEDDELR